MVLPFGNWGTGLTVNFKLGLTDLTLAISELVEKKFKIENARKYLIDINTFYNTFDKLADILDKNIEEVGLRQKISKELNRINLPISQYAQN